ncbi:MAG: hypothetical protein Sapg2KO_19110 [Saprospiraceae bacterium]
MGKGDKRSRKGKIWRGSYGNARPRKGNKVTTADDKKAETTKEKATS